MKHLFTALLILGSLPVFCQDLAGIKKQAPFKFSGGLAVRGGFYVAPDGQNARRSPYNWAVSGSPTFAFYGWSVPVTFTFQEQKFSYSRPFQRFGTSPRWRWVTLHAGYRNLTFSPYTLAGHTFLGGGLEINRKKIRLSAMSGNLQNAIIQSDTAVLGSRFLDTYTRRAHGLKLGLGTLANHVNFIGMRAFDRLGTANLPVEYRQSIHPADNIALGLELFFTFFKHFQLESSIGASAFTRDRTFYDVDTIGEKRLDRAKDFAEKFMDINLSTRLAFAGDAAARLHFPKWRLGVKYQRIEPNYTTLGAYYFQDDLENRTVDAGLRLFSGKLTLDGSFGQQRNNLLNLRALQSKRLIGSGSMVVSPSTRWGVAVQYSNFRAEQQPNFQNVADTFRFVQVNRMLAFSPYFNKPGKRFSQSLTMNFTHQVFDDLSEGGSVLPQNSLSRNVFANYRISFKKTGWRLSLGGNFNGFENGDNRSERYGATVGGGRSFLKRKLDLNLNSTFNIATADGTAERGSVQNHRLTTNLKLTKKQSLSFSFLWLNRKIPLRPGYSEQSGNVGYNLRF